MRLSVCMSVFNNGPFVDEAVRSVLAQTMGDFEFIIINDGSTDASGEILRAHAARDPRVRLVEQPNRGLIASLNHAIEISRTPWIARMDGDDVALPDRFGQQLAVLAANPDHGVVGGQHEFIDDGGHIFRQAYEYPETAEAFVDALEAAPLMSHPTVVMSRDLVRAAGGYRKTFAHCEDYDLWLRLSERTKLTSLPRLVHHHRCNPNQTSNRHLLAQKYGAAVAWEAYRERAAGRADPVVGLEVLPSLDQLDAVFGQRGVAARVAARTAGAILYSPSAVAGGGIPVLLEHARAGGAKGPLWRASLRLARAKRIGPAVALAAGLIQTAVARA